MFNAAVAIILAACCAFMPLQASTHQITITARNAAGEASQVITLIISAQDDGAQVIDGVYVYYQYGQRVRDEARVFYPGWNAGNPFLGYFDEDGRMVHGYTAVANHLGYSYFFYAGQRQNFDPNDPNVNPCGAWILVEDRFYLMQPDSRIASTALAVIANPWHVERLPNDGDWQSSTDAPWMIFTFGVDGPDGNWDTGIVDAVDGDRIRYQTFAGYDFIFWADNGKGFTGLHNYPGGVFFYNQLGRGIVIDDTIISGNVGNWFYNWGFGDFNELEMTFDQNGHLIPESVRVHS